MYYVNDLTNGFETMLLPDAPTLDDQITEEFLDTDTFLYRGRMMREQVRQASDRLERAMVNASGVTGIRYDRDRVQTSTTSHDDALIEVIEARQAYEDALSLLNAVRVETLMVIDKSDATVRQKRLLKLRYVASKDLSWSQIGKILGMTSNACQVMHNRAFAKVALCLERLREVA